jgi:hypothetical protein
MSDDGPDVDLGKLPLGVGRYSQPPQGDRLPLPGGGYTKAHKLYMIGRFPDSECPVVCGGPYRTDREIEEAMRQVVLHPSSLWPKGGDSPSA